MKNAIRNKFIARTYFHLNCVVLAVSLKSFHFLSSLKILDTQPSYCVLVSDGLDGKTINNTATKLLLKFCPKLKIEFFLSEAKLIQTVNFYDVSKVTIRLFYRYF